MGSKRDRTGPGPREDGSRDIGGHTIHYDTRMAETVQMAMEMRRMVLDRAGPGREARGENIHTILAGRKRRVETLGESEGGHKRDRAGPNLRRRKGSPMAEQAKKGRRSHYFPPVTARKGAQRHRTGVRLALGWAMAATALY